LLDNIRNNEQNKRQDDRKLSEAQEQKNRELRDNFKNIPKFMKDKGYE